MCGVFYEILWRLIDENKKQSFALQMKFVCLLSASCMKQN